MKTYLRLAVLAIVVLTLVAGGTSCKKDKEDPTPTFTVTASKVSIVGGGTGLQFSAVCTNTDVTMSSVTITNPESIIYLRKYNNVAYSKNAQIPLQGQDTAYINQAGTWKFSLVGKTTSAGTTFAIDANCTVTP